MGLFDKDTTYKVCMKALSVELKNMAAEVERNLQPIEVISYFVKHEKVTNHELIAEFRSLLNKENSFGQENHAFLKKMSTQLVVVKKLQGHKFLELKPKFKSLQPVEILRILQGDHVIGNNSYN